MLKNKLHLIILIDKKNKGESKLRNYLETLKLQAFLHSELFKSLDKKEGASTWDIINDFISFVSPDNNLLEEYESKDIYILIKHNYNGSDKYLKTLATSVTNKLTKDYHVAEGNIKELEYNRSTCHTIWGDIAKFSKYVDLKHVPVKEIVKANPPLFDKLAVKEVLPEAPKKETSKAGVSKQVSFPYPKTREDYNLITSRPHTANKLYEGFPESIKECGGVAIGTVLSSFYHAFKGGYLSKGDPKYVERLARYLRATNYRKPYLPKGVPWSVSGTNRTRYVRPIDLYYGLLDPNSEYNKSLDEQEAEVILKTSQLVESSKVKKEIPPVEVDTKKEVISEEVPSKLSEDPPKKQSEVVEDPGYERFKKLEELMDLTYGEGGSQKLYDILLTDMDKKLRDAIKENLESSLDKVYQFVDALKQIEVLKDGK